MPNIEEQTIVRKVEDTMHRDGQFDHPEIGGKVSAAARDFADNRLSNLSRELFELGD